MKSKPGRFQVKIPALKSRLPQSITWLQTLSRVIVDPDLNGNDLSKTLDILLFLSDVVVVVDPTPSNLHRLHYDVRRFSQLVNNKMFLPLFSGAHNPHYNIEIDRKDMFDDDEFWAEYEKAIESDLEDDDFCELVERLDVDPEDTAFSLNWDLINAQLLNAPIISCKSFKPLLQYKLEKSNREIGLPGSHGPATEGPVLKRFLYRALGVLPSGLEVPQLAEFRKDQRAKRFRRWFSDELDRASEASRTAQVAFDQNIYDDFVELARSYENKGSNIMTGVTGLAGIVGSALGAVIGGPIGAAAGAAPSAIGSYAFSGILKRVWERRSKHNWVFLFLDIRRKRRPN